MDSIADSGSSWEGWFQRVGGNVVDAWASATYSQPYEIQKLRLQALGSTGAYYAEGQPTPPRGNLGGITPAMLLLGGAALLAVLLLKD